MSQPLNRQARLAQEFDTHEPMEWESFGDVSLFEAARGLAIRTATERNYPFYVWRIEVRCESTPEIPVETYQIMTSIVAEVLDPRKGTNDE